MEGGDWRQAREESPTSCFDSWLKGKTEKYLYRQGSQRNAGTRKFRQTKPSTESTFSGAIRFRAELPQIGQWACSELLRVINRA
jgi:hypothetical protein